MAKKKKPPEPKPESRPKEPQEVSIQFASNALYIARTLKGIKISDLEDHVDFNLGYLASYASGYFQRGMPIDKAVKIAEYLGESLEDMCFKNYRREAAVKRAERKNKPVDRLVAELGLGVVGKGGDKE